METPVPGGHPHAEPALKPSLEGWKLGSIGRLHSKQFPLKPSLEGWKQLKVKGQLALLASP